MNILFIEDEKELMDIAAEQLRVHGRVFPVAGLDEARTVLLDESKEIDLVITDHRLMDGMGIQFAIELKQSYPNMKCAIVSGCLTSSDIEQMKKHELLYFHKPLLYGKVVDTLRKHYALKATVRTEPEPEAEPVVDEIPEIKVAPPKKRFFGLFGGKLPVTKPTEGE
ncbi:MAG: response regulator [Opitutales bacterium]|jgi:DNA-binding NtrC family response regulator|nr:response regulator [Opitutales bacterium]MDP4642960.1 response regulator [Opitutales bacterium]MDP4776534.1 response regulator [Opitutales bacterium]MDP4884418.1 response regulator [Opitutales bacterium]MDP5079330.1 response regulator [Opitutales bacterium]